MLLLSQQLIRSLGMGVTTKSSVILNPRDDDVDDHMEDYRFPGT